MKLSPGLGSVNSREREREYPPGRHRQPVDFNSRETLNEYVAVDVHANLRAGDAAESTQSGVSKNSHLFTDIDQTTVGQVQIAADQEAAIEKLTRARR